MAGDESKEGSYASIENLNSVKAYLLARRFGKIVWDIIIRWDYFRKKTIGDQWTISVDSNSRGLHSGRIPVEP